jgi:hypothetical protein
MAMKKIPKMWRRKEEILHSKWYPGKSKCMKR